MGWLDKVPQCGNLFIGGLYSLRRRDAVKDAGISHVVSVLRWPLDELLLKPFTHLQIDVDDVDDEDLVQYFPATNKFIEDALNEGGSVLVHCAMGKSRSATVVIAYMMHKLGLTPTAALNTLRESRGVVDPNDGFKKQLELYHAMGVPADVASHPQYQRWLFQCELEMSRETRRAPEYNRIRFEDEHVSSDSSAASAQTEAANEQAANIDLKCRKCRRSLATSRFIITHTQKQLKTKDSPPVPPSACAHYFLEPLSWMRPELEQGKLEGRLECPNGKCGANVGKYAWQGMQCSCGEWVVPGISLAKARLDEVKVLPGNQGGGMGIRMPPGRGAQGNL